MLICDSGGVLKEMWVSDAQNDFWSKEYLLYALLIDQDMRSDSYCIADIAVTILGPIIRHSSIDGYMLVVFDDFYPYDVHWPVFAAAILKI